MKQRTILPRAAVASLAALLLSLGTSASSLADGKDPYVIGAVLTLSGSGANLGQPGAQALQTLAKHVNDSGGIGGHPIEVRILDDNGDSTRTVAALRQLASDPKVLAVIGPNQSPNALAAKPVAEEEHIPLFALASSPAISHPPSPWVFQMPVPMPMHMVPLLEDMKKHHITKLALFTTNNDYGQLATKMAQDLAAKDGISVVDVEPFNPLSAGIDTEVTRAKGKGPEAFMIFAEDPGAPLLAKSMQNLGVTLPVYGDTPAATQSFLKVAGDSANDWHVIATKIDAPALMKHDDPLYPIVSDFGKLYPDNVKPNHFSGTARDAFVLITDALAKSGPDRAKLRAAVDDGHRFVGVTGAYAFTPTNHNSANTEGLLLIQGNNGVWKSSD
jgi:branched-chain amino acid transport system substrate-binding protein